MNGHKVAVFTGTQVIHPVDVGLAEFLRSFVLNIPSPIHAWNHGRNHNLPHRMADRRQRNLGHWHIIRRKASECHFAFSQLNYSSGDINGSIFAGFHESNNGNAIARPIPGTSWRCGVRGALLYGTKLKRVLQYTRIWWGSCRQQWVLGTQAAWVNMERCPWELASEGVAIHPANIQEMPTIHHWSEQHSAQCQNHLNVQSMTNYHQTRQTSDGIRWAMLLQPHVR